MTAKEHNKLLSVFFLVHGGLQLFGGIIIVLIYGGFGIAVLSNARRNEEQAMGGIFLVMAFVVGFIVLLFAGFALLTGWKLLKEKSSGRILGIIASCIALLGFPLGTALGIYGLWFLFGEQGRQFYAGGIGNQMNAYPPPPPNNWQ
ncbi:MAG: hypothetical protein ACR2HG_08725 [Pyrinomonadaceae bacterium]